jgi:hypothetical protein
MAQSLKDLGRAVSARRTVKLAAAQQKITDIRIRIQEILAASDVIPRFDEFTCCSIAE